MPPSISPHVLFINLETQPSSYVCVIFFLWPFFVSVGDKGEDRGNTNRLPLRAKQSLSLTVMKRLIIKFMRAGVAEPHHSAAMRQVVKESRRGGELERQRKGEGRMRGRRGTL